MLFLARPTEIMNSRGGGWLNTPLTFDWIASLRASRGLFPSGVRH
jgi:hypothetical protein